MKWIKNKIKQMFLKALRSPQKYDDKNKTITTVHEEDGKITCTLFIKKCEKCIKMEKCIEAVKNGIDNDNPMATQKSPHQKP